MSDIPRLTLNDGYKYYKKTNKNPVDKVTYLRIVGGFILYIMKKVFQGYEVDLSGGDSLGKIALRGSKLTPFVNDEGQVRGLAINWKDTLALWKENPDAKENKEYIYHFNEHSNGITYCLQWYKHKASLGNKSYYSLIFSRRNKRTVPKLIKDENEFFVVPQKENKYYARKTQGS